MAEQQQDHQPLGEGVLGAEAPRIVKISAGLSAEYAAAVIPPERLQGMTVKDAVNYVVREANLKDSYKTIAERVNNEIRKPYDITVRGEKVQPNNDINQYFLPGQTADGTEFGHVQIKVAATERGGLERII